MVFSMRRGVIRAFLVTLGFLAFAGPAGAAQPNIVFIITDDQRWDTLSYMPTVQSELVGRGVTFQNAFVTNPLCCPSRSSILTGTYSHTNRVYTNAESMGGFKNFRDGSTLATWLDDAGYETALIGKYLVGYPGGPYVPPGWDRWVGLTPGDVEVESGLGYYTYGYNIDGQDFPFVEQATYSTDFLAQEAVSFLQSAPRPFFLYFAPFGPHAPATPAERHASAFSDLPAWRPPSYNERRISDKPPWVRAKPRFSAAKRASLDAFRIDQLRSLLAVDDGVASILQTLSESGELANTIFVYMTDNGYLWGEHRLTRKIYPYEESIRTPFVVRYDALVATARTETRPVLGIDVAPTFAELAGTTAPGADGSSILPLLTAEEGAAWRSRFLVESLGATPPPYCAMRTLRHLFVTYSTGDRELYDLTADPYQLRNLAGQPASAKTVAALRKGLARLCNPPPPGLSRKLLCTKIGTNGSDMLLGSARYDIVCARSGDDWIDAGGAADYVFAEAGNDRVYARDGHRDVIVCGDGLDLAVVDSTDRPRSDCERVRRR
jgi:N-acetylglucosamine-6-sulfatase